MPPEGDLQDDWIVLGQQLNAAWIELRVPRTVSWRGPLTGECRIHAHGAAVDLPMVRFLFKLRVNDSDGMRDFEYPAHPPEVPVKLEADTTTTIRFGAPIQRQRGMRAHATVQLCARGPGWWPARVSLQATVTLAPPEPLGALAQYAAECCGLTRITWEVPSEYGIEGDFVARMAAEGQRHPLLEDVILGFFDTEGEIRGVLDIGERFLGPGAFILGPDRKRHAFSFPAVDAEQARQFLAEKLRPYEPEHHNLPIPGREPFSDAARKLPLPAEKRADEAARDLPAPSRKPDSE